MKFHETHMQLVVDVIFSTECFDLQDAWAMMTVPLIMELKETR